MMLALREFRTKGASDLKVLFRDAKGVAGGIPLVLLSDSDASNQKGGPGDASAETGRGRDVHVPQPGGPHPRGADEQPPGEG